MLLASNENLIFCILPFEIANRWFRLEFTCSYKSKYTQKIHFPSLQFAISICISTAFSSSCICFVKKYQYDLHTGKIC